MVQSYFGNLAAELQNNPFMKRLGPGKSFVRELQQFPLIEDQLLKEGKAGYPMIQQKQIKS